VIAVGNLFEVSPDWCQLDRAKPTIQSYRTALRSALRGRDELRECCVRCCRCEIEFLTVPANAGREDLRCPFGCRQLHRRQQSNRRSTNYYRTDAGRVKKKRLNARRQLQQRSETLADNSTVSLQAESPPASAEVQSLQAAQVEPPAPDTSGLSIELPGLQLTEAMLEHSLVLDYVLLLYLLIGRQSLTREQLLARLRERMRQHSLVHLNRRDYVIQLLHKQPP
jgi:hypothetical protein